MQETPLSQHVTVTVHESRENRLTSEIDDCGRAEAAPHVVARPNADDLPVFDCESFSDGIPDVERVDSSVDKEHGGVVGSCQEHEGERAYRDDDQYEGDWLLTHEAG